MVAETSEVGCMEVVPSRARCLCLRRLGGCGSLPRTDVVQHPMAPTSTLEIVQTRQRKGPPSTRSTPMQCHGAHSSLADCRKRRQGCRKLTQCLADYSPHTLLGKTVMGSRHLLQVCGVNGKANRTTCRGDSGLHVSLSHSSVGQLHVVWSQGMTKHVESAAA
jgi:hypothetical protein